jgi:hypothetical protein
MKQLFLGSIAGLLLVNALGCSRGKVQATAPAFPVPLVTVVKASAQDVPLYLETNAFSAELNLTQANGNELLALVQLYQALGGGWQ